jgi:hypothetical protein
VHALFISAARIILVENPGILQLYMGIWRLYAGILQVYAAILKLYAVILQVYMGILGLYVGMFVLTSAAPLDQSGHDLKLVAPYEKRRRVAALQNK